ncbi:hypothetical protein GCM10011371_32320 [Novosphingobium marinum]|uniref:Ankyrin repeat protein n=1 Tax=Novosphingobium marinum TaxID=1514948 RepID=A0A7Y9Y0V2_9SPHN|nr:ankyrin repeat domain-containing protein [Novosphingobium marinum]NYH96908.1 ankyrin repeat protein [Novosphingobium marinum]GGC42464.1 hypothetical protein GCM10011371_32320 [Novosphingobium marinum]
MKSRLRIAGRIVLPLLAAGMVAAVPAHAQFSKGYKFLEAVKKKDGVEVEAALNEPGSTLVNAKDVTSGETALHIVTARRDPTWLAYLIGKGANVNAQDVRGVTPLQQAINLGWTEGVEMLVSYGADLDQSNDAGETPLIAAVHRRNIPMLRALLKAGADPDRADNSGRSARDYAELTGSSQLLATIETNATTTGKKEKQAVYGPTM